MEEIAAAIIMLADTFSLRNMIYGSFLIAVAWFFLSKIFDR